MQFIKKIDKETNAICDKFINKAFFTDHKLNTSIIASIASREEQASNTIADYLFNKVPSNIIYSLTRQYDEAVNFDLLKHIDTKIYNYFSKLIGYAKDGIFFECSIETDKIEFVDILHGKFLLLVPMRIFFVKDVMYIYFYIPEKRKCKMIEGGLINSSKITGKEYTGSLLPSKSDINKHIDMFTTGLENAKDCIVLQITPALLSSLKELKLIDDFEIIKEHTFSTATLETSVAIGKKCVYDAQDVGNCEEEIDRTYFEHKHTTVEERAGSVTARVYATKFSLLFISKMFVNQIKFIDYKSIKCALKPFLKDIGYRKNITYYFKITLVCILFFGLGYIVRDVWF